MGRREPARRRDRAWPKGAFGTVRSASLTVRSRPDTAGVGRRQAGRRRRRRRSPAARSRADGYTWYRVSRAAHHLGAGPTGPSGGLGRREARRARRTWRRGRRRTRPSSTPASPGCRSGRPVRPRSGPRPSALRGAGVLARRRRLGGRARPPLAERRRARLAHPAGPAGRRRHACSGARAVPDVAAGAQAWTWDGSVGGKRRPRRPLSPPARRARRRPDLHAPRPPTRSARNRSRAFAVTSTPVRPTHRHGDASRRGCSRRTATVGSTPSPSRPRRPATPPAGGSRAAPADRDRARPAVDPDDRGRRRRRREATLGRSDRRRRRRPGRPLSADPDRPRRRGQRRAPGPGT